MITGRGDWTLLAHRGSYKTTCLGVHVLAGATHIAGLPVAVNVSCHVTRHKTATL